MSAPEEERPPEPRRSPRVDAPDNAWWQALCERVKAKGGKLR